MLLKLQTHRLVARPRFTPLMVVLLLSCLLIYGRGRLLPRSLGLLDHVRRRPIILPRPMSESWDQILRERQQEFEREAMALENATGANEIYGKTLKDVVVGNVSTAICADALRPAKTNLTFTNIQPLALNPYPYHQEYWQSRHAEYVPCMGPAGTPLGNVTVFEGHLRGFPNPAFGSYELLGLSLDVCFERETRMGPYGLVPVVGKDGKRIDWDRVNWGVLQTECWKRNEKRFPSEQQLARLALMKGFFANQTFKAREARTALLLRSYTGKHYSDNDKQVIRSLITELSLQTGGEYEVFLFLHVKDDTDIWASEEIYQQVIETHVPCEFWNMTILWNTEKVKQEYPELPSDALLVHNSQFSPVQIFMQEHQEFDYVWNWEMDSRVIGHHYDILSKLAKFAREQPRKGLWERNERYYIPSFHGDYNKDFRKTVEQLYAGDSIWGAAQVPVVGPTGPEPPVSSEDDDYEWGVGEEADLITLSPMFNPVHSDWILRGQIWGYGNREFVGDLPRRATIITQVRASRRLMNIMHAENLRGNHLASEMVAQTVALLHGLKAVYVPMPVFFDRPWDGAQLARYFNGGPRGESGGFGSAMGWGREGRFQGSTWYFRAVPPQRMYNNWMGYEDTGVGGPEWEAEHGRPCLPMMILHPVKEVGPTERGYLSDSKLPY
ncbi:hypothetical protein QBC47DRAFT_219875 [Echria macrotheca]|uniref:Uncharacterized protein n=1 Tax=Echria macrotheca TaxID=438768 RepID=A0AAJ0BD15_9PEZI|nr:hypothetical protein QBC47DRAFT_219875 [Echria macrotheca]